jgi:hypothetical protein
MGGMSSHIIWRQRYDGAADLTLARALATLQCEVRELPSQQWNAETASIGGVRDYQCSYVSPAAPEWSSVLLHLDSLIGERLAAELSGSHLHRPLYSRNTIRPLGATRFFSTVQNRIAFGAFQKSSE